MSRTFKKSNMSVKITRLACSFQPPSISIEYNDGSKEPKFRQFPVVFGSFSLPEALYQTLTTDYPDFFNSKSISQNKLRKFLQIIIKKAPTVDLSAIAQNDEKEYAKYKQQMEREFEMNAVKAGDPGYQYDLRADIEADEPCDWDDE